MTDQDCRRLVAQCLQNGMSLSDIQKLLASDHDMRMTYLDLRLLAAELDVDWEALEPEAPAEDLSPETALDAEPEPALGSTAVTVSKLVRPGAAMSGSVTFASGAKAEWYVDSMGRLGLNPDDDSSQPTQDDIQDFQVELQKQMTGMA